MGFTAIYRADGDKNIGMGHLYRGFFIHNELKKKNIETVFIFKENKIAISFALENNISHIPMDPDISVDKEIALLSAIIKKKKPCVTFLDVLENDINLNYTNVLHCESFLFIAITDDSFYRPVNADIIINGNPNQEPSDYFDQPGDYCVGPEYFIMDPGYSSLELPRPLRSPENVLLTFGGTDHNDLLFRVLDSMPRDCKLTIISSKSAGYLDELKKYLNGKRKGSYDLHIDVRGLKKYWNKSDIAITAGGNTLFERISTRMPGATLCQLKRQMEIADKFEELDVNINLGFGPSLSKSLLKNKIGAFLNDTETHLRQFHKSPKIMNGSGLILLMNKIDEQLRRKKYEQV